MSDKAVNEMREKMGKFEDELSVLVNSAIASGIPMNFIASRLADIEFDVRVVKRDIDRDRLAAQLSTEIVLPSPGLKLPPAPGPASK